MHSFLLLASIATTYASLTAGPSGPLSWKKVTASCVSGCTSTALTVRVKPGAEFKVSAPASLAFEASEDTLLFRYNSTESATTMIVDLTMPQDALEGVTAAGGQTVIVGDGFMTATSGANVSVTATGGSKLFFGSNGIARWGDITVKGGSGVVVMGSAASAVSVGKVDIPGGSNFNWVQTGTGSISQLPSLSASGGSKAAFVTAGSSTLGSVLASGGSKLSLSIGATCKVTSMDNSGGSTIYPGACKPADAKNSGGSTYANSAFTVDSGVTPTTTTTGSVSCSSTEEFRTDCGESSSAHRVYAGWVVLLMALVVCMW